MSVLSDAVTRLNTALQELGVDLPGFPGTQLQLDVQNLAGNGYVPYLGVPETGRFTRLRLVHWF